MEARELPGGTVTLLFTDIEGSTRLLQELGREAYVRALTAHRRLLRETVNSHGGVEVEMQGDCFHFAFPSAHDALAAAVAGQRALHEHTWESQPIRVRMGLHTGEPMQADGLYAGLDVHRTARVMSAGHGGQVLLTEQTAELVGGELPAEIALRDLGKHRLKDLSASQKLYQALADGLPVEFAPLKTLVGPRTNLPIPANRLVGREAELEEIHLHLGRDVRLLTLTGPGGAGKTRLALQAAGELRGQFTDGVAFVSLAPIGDPRLVVAAVAQTLDLRDDGAHTTEETLAEFLASSSMLLILDNFEHVIEASDAVAWMLRLASSVTILVTSREPLRIAGEEVLAVPPLSVPEASQTVDATRLMSHSATALFMERCRAARSDLDFSRDEMEAVASICRRLDGLPLAIELAAARTAILSPTAILSRLDQQLRLLTRGTRDAEERHRSLRATIDWSYELLGAWERTLFENLGVFVGGFQLDAVESVCGVDDFDVLDDVTSLVSKNLLRRTIDVDGTPRFWMLETIREYALEKLTLRPDIRELRDRHTRYFAGLAEEAELGLKAAEEGSWVRRLESEWPNLREAIERSIATRTDAALVILGALWRFCERGAAITEARDLLNRALAAGSPPPIARASALYAATRLAFRQGDYAGARPLILEARDLFIDAGSLTGEASSVSALGWIEGWTGSAEASYDLCRRAVELARTAGDPWVLADALNNLGCALMDCGDLSKAHSMHSEALQCRLALGDGEGVTASLGNLGCVALADESWGAAADLFERSATIAADREDRWGVAMSLLSSAKAAIAEGAAGRGADRASEAYELALAYGYRAVTREIEELAAKHNFALFANRASIGSLRSN